MSRLTPIHSHCNLIGVMSILGFRHRGLRRFVRSDWQDRRGIPPDRADKLRRQLHALDLAERPADMDLPGWRLHPLGGDRHGFWAVDVSANYRLVFRFEGRDATDIELIDYH